MTKYYTCFHCVQTLSHRNEHIFVTGFIPVFFFGLPLSLPRAFCIPGYIQHNHKLVNNNKAELLNFYGVNVR